MICVLVPDVKAQRQPVRIYIPTRDDSLPLEIYSAAISPDGMKLAMVGNSNIVRIFDIDTGNIVQTLKRHENFIQSVAFSNDSKWIITGGWDQQAILWDVNTGQIVQKFRNPTTEIDPTWGFVYGVAISPNKQKIAMIQSSMVTLWDVESGKQIRQLPRGNIQFLPDNRRLLVEDGIYDLVTGETEKLYIGNVIDITPDFKKMVLRNENGISVWDVNSIQLIIQLPNDLIGSPLIKLSPDGKRILRWIYGYGPTINIDEIRLENISLSDGLEMIWTVPQVEYEPYHKALFTPDGNGVLTFTKNTAYLWDIRDLTASVKNATEVNR
jgi:WD40 repeat protein